MRKIISLTAIALIGAAGLVGCSSNDSGSTVAADCTPAHPDLTTVADGKLTVSSYTLAPFLIAEGTSISGVEGDILHAVAEMECLDVVGQAMDSGSVVTAVQQGRVDVAAGNWYCTQARADEVGLAGPIYSDQLGIVSTEGFKTIAEMEGHTVGVPDGYGYVDDFKKIFGDNLRIFPNPTAMYQDLSAGRVDAVVDSFGSGTYSNEQNGDKWTIEVPEPDDRVAYTLEPGQVCFPVKDEPMRAAIMENVEQLRQDGTLAQILEDANLDPSAAEPGGLRLI